jgi:hypothetical protein
MIYSDWRQNRWRTNVWFLQWDQGKENMDPIVLQKLRDCKEVQTDLYYAYRNAGKVIERIILEEFKAGGPKAFHIPRENTKVKPKINQRKLFATNHSK